MPKIPVSQWSNAEMLEWGMKEDELRQQELAKVNSPESLKAVQNSAKQRRSSVGASHGQAFSMILMAQQHKRRQNA